MWRAGPSVNARIAKRVSWPLAQLDRGPYGHYDVTMSQMGAARFKAECLQVMEKVRRTRREVVITKRGVPVAKIVPVTP